MAEIIEMGTVSSRGQIAIPSDIRQEMNLEEGARVLFVLEDDMLLMKKVTALTFAEVTKPLKDAAQKAGLQEADVSGIVRRFRTKRQ